MNGDQGPFKDKQESRENAQLDDEIIELVDVVREGDNLPDSDVDDLAPLLDQTEGTEEAQPFSEGEGEILNRVRMNATTSCPTGLRRLTLILKVPRISPKRSRRT
jgi:hypothetical protein